MTISELFKQLDKFEKAYIKVKAKNKKLEKTCLNQYEYNQSLNRMVNRLKRQLLDQSHDQSFVNSRPSISNSFFNKGRDDKIRDSMFQKAQDSMQMNNALEDQLKDLSRKYTEQSKLDDSVLPDPFDQSFVKELKEQ